MEPIIESIHNPEGQSFYARKYDIDHQCKNPGWHIHPEYELVFVRNGSGVLHVGSHISQYSNGLLIFLGPHIPHMPFDNHERQDNSEVVIQFKESFPSQNLAIFPEFQKIVDLCQRAHQGIVFGDGLKSSLSSELLAFCQLPKPQQLCKFFEILFTLSQSEDYQLLGVQGIGLNERHNDYSRINRVYNYVAEHYQREIRTIEVAELIGLTTNSFCRFFKKLTGKSFVQFLNEFRVNKAIETMNLSPKTIAEVMYDTGFNDPSFFNRQFKRVKGYSPSSYKKLVWQNQALKG